MRQCPSLFLRGSVERKYAAGAGRGEKHLPFRAQAPGRLRGKG